LLHPNLKDLLWRERIKKKGEWKDAVQKLCLIGRHTEARAANRTHFYGSRIWINVPKGRYNIFSCEQHDRRS